MTITKGVDWGQPGVLPPGAPVAHTDAQARRILLAELGGAATPTTGGESARPPGAKPVVFGLLGGDLCRTVGGTGDRGRLSSEQAMQLPIDVVSVRIDGGEATRFVAHLVARGRGWRGPFLLALNAEWLGRWKAGPRAHPGDGLLDIIHGSLGWRDRLRASRRARFGAHLPHPALHTEAVAEFAFRFARPRRVWLDGEPHGWASRIDLAVQADAAVCVV